MNRFDLTDAQSKFFFAAVRLRVVDVIDMLDYDPSGPDGVKRVMKDILLIAHLNRHTPDGQKAHARLCWLNDAAHAEERKKHQDERAAEAASEKPREEVAQSATNAEEGIKKIRARVMAAAKHLSAGRMAWVFNRISAGCDWRRCSKGHMAKEFAKGRLNSAYAFQYAPEDLETPSEARVLSLEALLRAQPNAKGVTGEGVNA